MTDIARGRGHGLLGPWLLLGCSLMACGKTTRESHVAAAGGTEMQSNAEPEACKVQPLSAICPEGGPCPATPEDVPFQCEEQFAETTRAATTCGGTLVHTSTGFVASDWYFDAKGALVGLRSVSDTGPSCVDTLGVIYGEVCDAVGQEEDLCRAACTNQPPLSKDGALLTEESYDFGSLCADATIWQITQAATACDGKLYVVTRNDGWFERYCFDEGGRLIGSGQEDPMGEPVEMLGATCRPSGANEPLCAKKAR